MLALGIINLRNTFFEKKKRRTKLKVSGHHFSSWIQKHTKGSMKWDVVGMPGGKFLKQWERNVEEIRNTSHRSPSKQVHFYSNRHIISFSPLKSMSGNFKPLQKTGQFLKNTKILSTLHHRRNSSSSTCNVLFELRMSHFSRAHFEEIACQLGKGRGGKVKVTPYQPERQATRSSENIFRTYILELTRTDKIQFIRLNMSTALATTLLKPLSSD